MIEILHYILDVLWTLVKIGFVTGLILFIIAVCISLVDEIMERNKWLKR